MPIEKAHEFIPSYGRRGGRTIRKDRRKLLDELLPEIRIQLSGDRVQERVSKPASLVERGSLGSSRRLASRSGNDDRKELDSRLRGNDSMDEKSQASKPLVAEFFQEHKKIFLEIGFGSGEHIAQIAAKNPKVGFIGSEVYEHGVTKLLDYIKYGVNQNSHSVASEHAFVRARAQNPVSCADTGGAPQDDDYAIKNIRVFTEDARLLLDELPENSLDRVYILFPDPWPKLRHHKRRLISSDTLKTLSRVLKPGGLLRIATDHGGYLKWIMAHVLFNKSFMWLAEKSSDWKTPPKDHFTTRYEEKEKAGKPTYLDFTRK